MSLKTNNFKLYKYEDNDIGDLRFINDSMNIIDKGLVLDVGESTGSGNNYILNLGSITLTSANKGISFKFWSDKDSKGAVTINGTYKLIKANGSSVTNLKAGAPYTITYDGGTNFFLASGGGLDTVNFTSDKLLTGYSANDSNGEKVNGTMPNNGAKTASLNCGGSYTIPKGYHNGSGKVTANSLSSQTSANAMAKDIIKGKTAWVNGSKITGTATIQSLGGLQLKKELNIYVASNPTGSFNSFSVTSTSTIKYAIVYCYDSNNILKAKSGIVCNDTDTSIYKSGSTYYSVGTVTVNDKTLTVSDGDKYYSYYYSCYLFY